MTKDELDKLLDGNPLHQTLDVKTLVLDLFKEMPAEELEAVFWDRLPDLQEEFVRDYFFMRRG